MAVKTIPIEKNTAQDQALQSRSIEKDFTLSPKPEGLEASFFQLYTNRNLTVTLSCDNLRVHNYEV